MTDDSYDPIKLIKKIHPAWKRSKIKIFSKRYFDFPNMLWVVKFSYDHEKYTVYDDTATGEKWIDKDFSICERGSR